MGSVITMKSGGFAGERCRNRSKDSGISSHMDTGSQKNHRRVFPFLIILIIMSGAFYLYHVNDLATKGFEMRDIENRIERLQKDHKNIEIKEVELRSMYNIEKASQNLETISPASVSYVELNGPVAMK